MKYAEYKNYFFVGIGGIGMSALAKYLFQNNKTIYGYDRVQSKITDQLVKAGIDISYMFTKSLIELKRLNLKVNLLIYIKFIKISFICSKNPINSMFLENNLDFMNI